MTQSLAMLVDASRELRSRYLFWIALALSAIVATSLFGVIGFDEKGWKVLWFATNESDMLRKGSPRARSMMMMCFSLFVRWWLCWGAVVLALVSTASILPGFLTDGAVELSLSKPISRARIFALKVFGALLFMAVQTGITVLLAYFLLGLRLEMWAPRMLWTIPLVLVQFLYIYAISAFVAVLTRSTLASLLVALLFWAMVAIVQFTSNQVDSFEAQTEAMIEPIQANIDRIRERAAKEGREPTRPEQLRIDAEEARLEPFRKQLGVMAPFKRPINTIELVVPKTGDVQKIIANVTNAPTLNQLMQGVAADMRPAQFDADEWQEMQAAGLRGERAVRRVDSVRSLGTSLAFTAVVLALATAVFMRRDY